MLETRNLISRTSIPPLWVGVLASKVMGSFLTRQVFLSFLPRTGVRHATLGSLREKKKWIEISISRMRTNERGEAFINFKKKKGKGKKIRIRRRKGPFCSFAASFLEEEKSMK